MEYTTVCTRHHSDKGFEEFKQWVHENGLTKYVVIETTPNERMEYRGKSNITIYGEKANMLFMLRWGGKIERVQ